MLRPSLLRFLRHRSGLGPRARLARRAVLAFVATALSASALARAAEPDTTRPLPASMLRDLPLIEIRSRVDHGVIAVHLTGDGGYDHTDKALTEILASQGVPVVVLDSRKYFGAARTPDGAAADLARILRFYLPTWQARRFVISGYSFGADVLPFLLNRLPADLRPKLVSATFLSLSGEAAFRCRLTDRVGLTEEPRYPVLPELERLRGEPMFCFYGTNDKDAIGPRLDPALVTGYKVPGGHQLGKRSQLVAERILETIRHQLAL